MVVEAVKTVTVDQPPWVTNMDRITCLAVNELPGGCPVVITQIGTSVYVYLSKEYDLETIAASLGKAMNARQASTVTLR